QARSARTIASQLHASMKVPDAAGRHFLSLLDGTHDLQALAAEMIAYTQSSAQNLLPNETDGKENLEEKVRERVKNNLVSLMRAGMLVAYPTCKFQPACAGRNFQALERPVTCARNWNKSARRISRGRGRSPSCPPRWAIFADVRLFMGGTASVPSD